MKLRNRLIIATILVIVLLYDTQPISQAVPPTPPCSTFDGTIINAMESTDGWSVGSGDGVSLPALIVVPGYAGSALQLDYDLGTTKGAWVQLRYDFNPPLDLSADDHLRFIHKGNQNNSIEIGFVSTESSPINPNYFASSWNRATNVPWWTYATWDFQGFRKVTNGQTFSFPDFIQVKAIFVSVANIAVDDVGGSGSFIVDELQSVNLASRTVPTSFAALTVNQADLDRAATWIGQQQQPNGLLKSWYEETVDFSWLYDQALGLLVLAETDMPRARLLFNKLHNLQNADGSWYFGYHYSSPITVPIDTKKDIGPIAWLIYALTRYSLMETNSTQAALAYTDARQSAAWLATQQAPNGSVSASITEWNLDAWWAFQATGYQTQANRLRDFLLNQVWDSNMGRFKSSSSTYQIFLDNQTWGAPFLRALGRYTDVHQALSYAQETLLILSSDESICGFDGAGPFSVWNEGTYQYIAMRGDNSQYYWDSLASQQAAGGGLDGALSNSPDNYLGYIVWLSTWHGIAPTAWFYFAGTGGPFTVSPAVPPNTAPHLNYYTTLTPTLTWNCSVGASCYDVQVDNNPDFSSPEYSATCIPGLSVTVTLPTNGSYRWRVRARGDSGVGIWSYGNSVIDTHL